MTAPDYTTVVGVDAKHFGQLCGAWQTWRQHKPSLLEAPMVVFFDRVDLKASDICGAVRHPELRLVAWPPDNVVYEGEVPAGSPADRYAAYWHSPQRHKMLAGYVHVPALVVNTPWWLKLDSCVFAEGRDGWIDPEWFEGSPVIVSHRWGYTKPPGQMAELDRWVEDNQSGLDLLSCRPALNLEPSGDRVKHKRITSWCGFFKTSFTEFCSTVAGRTMGPWKLPVPSQDGFMWYVAKRMGLGVKRVNMKAAGWSHRPVRDFSMKEVE